ncbi:MAG: PEP/pyruvate-binding domain-containing protein [Anaerolineaceae bacterium]|nr:PEP/pyruvate-binding domain-containing protein [Anaerolineaceae bacterium]
MYSDAGQSKQLVNITLILSQYPILSKKIRARMRRELFKQQLVEETHFEKEVRQEAIKSQEREGLENPFLEEPAEMWERRLEVTRDYLTDLYFSKFMNPEQFNTLVKEVLGERGIEHETSILSINPELAPQNLLFEQALTIESYQTSKRRRMDPRLQEIKVVLIKNLISDHLPYINIAKEWFTISDLAEIRKHRIGPGRIGGKAAGMLLASTIIKSVGDKELIDSVNIPKSFFVGADLFYVFMSMNNLVHWNDQKYKSEDQMRRDYPQIVKKFEDSKFPPEILEELERILNLVGKTPLIVRSSSLLEDNFGASFVGKYESVFCPNQKSTKVNLRELCRAIKRVYATTLNPDALLYRRRRGLLDYDERMAVLIQVVVGEKQGKYYMPQTAGVAFSHNQFRWSPQIEPEAGFVRLVWGLGTRAVDRVGNDYPRLIALSHPLLYPSNSIKSIRRYSQQYVDLIDLDANKFCTLPIGSVLSPGDSTVRLFTQVEQDGYIQSLLGNIKTSDIPNLIFTFEDFIKQTKFVPIMKKILGLLEGHYHAPVDIEFTANIINLTPTTKDVEITIVQCRPQSRLSELKEVRIPPDLKKEDMVFSTWFMVPRGHIPKIRYILFVPPEEYFKLDTLQARNDIGRIIGSLNQSLKDETFICIGPGRWGTSNPDLGIYVNYSDIYNAKALVELTGKGRGAVPEPSLGTHFFQDLLEAQIYPLVVNLDDSRAYLNQTIFFQSPDQISRFHKDAENKKTCLKVIDITDYKPEHHVEIMMDDEKGRAVAYLMPDITS